MDRKVHRDRQKGETSMKVNKLVKSFAVAVALSLALTIPVLGAEPEVDELTMVSSEQTVEKEGLSLIHI